MSLTPSTLYMNWSSVTFTPTGGTALPVNRVTAFRPKRTGNKETFKGDLDVFFRLIAVPSQERTIEIESGNVGSLIAIPINTPGILTATLGDARNGISAAGGGFTITLTDCLVTDNPFTGDHAKFSSGTLTFEAYAPDGVTDPLTVTAL